MSKVVVSNTGQTPRSAAARVAAERGPLVGKSIGSYEVVSYIGEGPTGAVYRCEADTRRLAIKIMHRELSRPEPAAQLAKDLKLLAELRNPHFVHAYDTGFGDDGEFFITMDELVGVDLESALEDSGALAPRRAVEIVTQICDALEQAHAVGVVHGGLKPRNIFLSPTASSHGPGKLTVKVLDFGNTRLAGGADKGVIVGNPFYMAPEQFGGVADERTDVYSLGVIMYELFSGTLPFSGPSHGQVMMRHLAEQPQPPPGVDTELGHIILKALGKAPAGRFSSVAKLHEALKTWAGNTRALEDAAAVQVMARAAEARKMKHAALSQPDATAPMAKIDLVDLANATKVEAAEASSHNKKRMGNGSMNQTITTRKESNPNSPESVEASLEDFISQANASFPASGNTDGWDLHTGDVELVDDEDNVESDEQPVVKPRNAKAQAAAQLIKKNDLSARKLKASLEEPTPLPPPAGELPASLKAKRKNPFEVPLELEEPEPLGPVPTGPKRRAERTEVVSSPLPRVAPWTSSPLMWIGGVVAAFMLGAGLVFVMVRTMMPSQPVVVQTPPTVVVQPPAPAPAATAPVVTPLAKQPVVTPLEQPKVEEPAIAEPVVSVEKHRAAKHHAAVKVAAAPVAAPAPVKAAPVAKAAPAKKSNKLSLPDESDDDDSAPAAAPAKAAAPKAKPAKAAPAPKAAAKKGDWVDPFAQ
jgi:serine/threonine protein kinase